MVNFYRCLPFIKRLDPRYQSPPEGIFDPWIPTLGIGLALFGWVMISSAAINSELGPYHYSIRQGIYLVIALTAAFLVSLTPFRYWRKVEVAMLGAGFSLLVVVLAIGPEINGSRRWIHLPSPLPTIQPSEIVKIGLALYFARFISKYQNELASDPLAIVRPMLVLVPLYTLLLAGKDFGSIVIYTLMVGGVVFLSGPNKKGFFIACVIILMAVIVMAISAPYRVMRLFSYWNPWSDPFGSGYQLTQSLIGFGRGGLLGTGLGNGVQKLGFLPEPHNDFIFSIIGEELGILGSFITLFALIFLCYRIFIISYQAEEAGRTFPAFFCYAVFIMMLAQVGINVAVATGLLPTKGLTLPLISYGGSSLIVTSILLGMVFRVDLETRFLLAWRERKRLKKLELKRLQHERNVGIYLPYDPRRLPG